MSMPRYRPLIVFLALAFLTCFPPATSAQSAVYLAGFPTLKQQHSLTCESSAASMATRDAITESQLMSVMPRSWNPNLGFRGNPNGRQGTTLVDYGVYAQPLHNALWHYGYRSAVLMYEPDASLMAYIDKGWPVVTWITYALQPAQPRLGSANGEQFFLVPHEHAVLVVGYNGSQVIANDPWTGRVVAYDWGNFNRAWGYFGRMALAVEPCAMPSPVGDVSVSALTSVEVTWDWKPAPKADHYQVVLKRVDGDGGTVWHGSQTALNFTFRNPILGAQYQIAVRSVSACNGTSRWTRLWTQIPATLATPVESTLVPPTPVATPGTGTPVPAATVTPTP